MKTEVVVPQMGESVAEGTIARWLKKVGDAVDRDEPLFELSTDKVDAEIPSPAAGVLVAIHVPEGASAPVNSVIAVIQGDGEAEAAAAAGPATAGSRDRQSAPTLTPSSPVGRDFSPGGTDVRPGAANVNPGGADVGPGGPHRASPVARTIARTHNLDLGAIAGSGGAGRITKQDVLRHLAGGIPAATPAAVKGPAASPARVDTVPMTVMRRKIAEHMIASRRISAHVHSVFQVDCSRVERIRKASKAQYEAAGVKVSVLPFIFAATAAALRDFPVLNASLEGDSIVYHGDINLGVAVALDSGLIVPVIRQADRLSVIDIARAIADLARRARAKQLKPEEVAGGTFTITNPGNFGGSFATPIINQPQVAILELGTMEPRVTVVNDAVAIRPMINLTLGFDHRLVDGAAADQFLGAIKRRLEGWDERT